MSLLPLFLKLLVLLRKSRGNQTHMQERVSSDGKCQRVLCAKVIVGPGSLPKATRHLKTLFSRTPHFAEFVFATLFNPSKACRSQMFLSIQKYPVGV